MWARYAEILFGMWLVPSAFWLRSDESGFRLALDFAIAAAVTAIALACHRPAYARAHVITLALGLGLAALGWWGDAWTRGAGVPPERARRGPAARHVRGRAQPRGRAAPALA